MNDDELGRALRTALAPPAVTPAGDAGARLRARARRARTERLAVGGAVVLVLAVLLTVAAVRGIGGPPAPTAAVPAVGHRLLTTPLVLNRYGPAPSPGPCTAGAQATCGPAVLVVDEVAGLRTTDLPERGGIVEITLTAADAATLRAAIGPGPDATLSVGVGQGGYFAQLKGDVLRVPMASTQSADAFVTELGPVAPPPPRTGPGRLELPVQLWTVTGSAATPCPVAAAPPGTLVLNRAGECLTLTGPGLVIATADLQLSPPPEAGQGWQVSVGTDDAGLRRYTAAHVGDRVAFVAGGHVYGSVPVIEGPISSSIAISFPDRDSAVAFLGRLRP